MNASTPPVVSTHDEASAQAPDEPSGKDLSASTAPVGGPACVWRGTVNELAAQLKERSQFLTECTHHYADAGFGVVDDAEHRSWVHSWPPLTDALIRAGLGQLQIYLEYATAGGAGRMDALLLGATPQHHPALLVVELKQWTHVDVLTSALVRRSDGVEVPHPTAQVAGYLAYLREWFHAGETPVDVRGVVFLHNATPTQVGDLRASRDPATTHIPILSGTDLQTSVPRPLLTQRLLAADLQPPSSQQIADFNQTRWAPSKRLLNHVADMLEKRPAFHLVGDQQHALLTIHHAAEQALAHGHHTVIAVEGGPGSGKTVIATRLLARLFRHKDAKARYVTPSGTLRAQLHDAAGASARDAAGKDLFLSPHNMLSNAAQGSNMMILDEAQRLKKTDGTRGLLPHAVQRVPVLVLFLDERQIIRPDEGVTLDDLRALANAHNANFQHLTLSGCFRSNASRAYAQWVEELLYGTPHPWASNDYDLAVADNPQQLQDWIDHHTAAGATARTAAGFCWPWKRDQPTLIEEVRIPWTDPNGQPHLWKAPWNAGKASTGPIPVPHRTRWATDTGGHRQVGCIYTAQGLEYEHGGVIIGPDLVCRNGAWHADPQRSHDPELNYLAPAAYLPLALNIYRVLLTRSTRTTRIYSTDPETQSFLNDLIPTRP